MNSLRVARPARRAGRLAALLIAILISSAALAACDRPFSVPEVEQPAATPTPAAPSPTPVPTVDARGGTPSPVVAEGEAPGTTIPAPRPPPPPPASGDQLLTLAGSRTGPRTLDPALARDAESAFLIRQIFRGLVRFDEELNPVPDLAARVEISADGARYTFTLHEDVTFHDGRRITAGDVAFSLERATDPALAGGADLPARGFLRDILGAEERMAGRADRLEGVEVVDDATLRITLEEPSAGFLMRLTGTPALVVDRGNVAAGDGWWRTPNGSGPFRLDVWRPGERLELVAHQGYTVAAPTLERVVILLGASALSPLTLYERDRLDIAAVPAAAVERFQAPNSPFRDDLIVQPMLSTSMVLINPNVEPFDSRALRRALVHAFDRERMLTATLGGLVTPPAGIVPAGMLGSDRSVAGPEYDLARARELLSDAEIDLGGRPLTFSTSGSRAPVIMRAVYARDLGLDVEVVQLDWHDYTDDLNARRLGFFTLEWIADTPDPVGFLWSLFHSESPNNYIGYRNPRVDRLIEEAGSEPDAERRSALLAEAEQLIIDDAVVMPLFHAVEYTAVKPHVRGVVQTPIGILGLESVWVQR